MKRLLGRPGAALFLLALVLQTAYFVTYVRESPFAQGLVGDAYHYDGMARSLVEHSFGYEGVFHQAPFYPYFVAAFYAAFGSKPLLVGGFQVLLGAAIAWFLWRIGRRLGGPRAGIFAGLLGTFYGPLWAFAPRLLPVVPTVFLQLLFLDRALAEREAPRARWVIPGVLLGVLCAVRPNHLLLLALIVVAALARRLPARAAATMTACVALVLAPITLHNVRADGSFLLVSSNAGETFAHGNNAEARGTYSLVAGLRSGSILRQEEIAREIAEGARGRPLRASEVQRYWFERGLSFIRENPAAYAWLELQKLRLMAGAEEVPDIYSPSMERNRFTPFLRIGFLSSLWILPLAIAGVAVGWRRLSPWWWALVLTEAATLLVFYVSNRYRLSWEILLLVPAGLALASARRRATLAFLLPGIVLAVLLHTTSSEARRNEQWGMTLTNLGASFARAERYADAENAFRSAIEILPGWARSHQYLGRVLARDARWEPAAAALRRALEIDPSLVEARVDLVALELARGRPDDARREWALIPGDPSLPVETIRPALRAGATLLRMALDAGDCDAARTILDHCRALAGGSDAVADAEAAFADRCTR